MCNDDKIILRNTSVHQTGCPSCFTWDLPGVDPDSLVVDTLNGTATFSYASDASDELWKLVYVDSTNLCEDSLEITKDVNVDYLDAKFITDLTVICEASGDVQMTSTSVVDNDIYTYNWTFDNNLGTVVSELDSIDPLITLPDPGIYDITLQAVSYTHLTLPTKA